MGMVPTLGAHDARVPGETRDHDETQRDHHIAQQRDAIAHGEVGRRERGEREGDGEVAAVQHHHERQRGGGGDAGGESAGGKVGGRRAQGLRQAAEAVGSEIEEGGEQHREQRERDRAVELRHAQVGEDQGQQRGHDSGKGIERGRRDGQRAAAPQAQRSKRGDGERGNGGENQESRHVVGQPQYLGDGRGEQTRVRRRFEAGPGGNGAERDRAGKGGGRRDRRAAPGGQRQNRHRNRGKQGPLRIVARAGKRQDGQHRQSRQGRRRDPIGGGLVVGRGKMRLERHEGGSQRQLQGDVHEQGGRPVAGRTARLGEHDGAPDEGARDHGGGEPQPAAQPGQRIGRRRDNAEIDHERPRIGRV